MGSGSVAFVDVGQAMDEILILLFASLMAGVAGWFTCYGMYLAWVKMIATWRHRRTEAARRAEVARGLADIERFLKAQAARAIPGDSPDSSGENPSS
jgi:hypothetical protein